MFRKGLSSSIMVGKRSNLVLTLDDSHDSTPHLDNRAILKCRGQVPL